jgi:sterol desaturase/sphingolipid hydroxylase (fatty acid hydroxylase superfamily)
MSGLVLLTHGALIAVFLAAGARWPRLPALCPPKEWRWGGDVLPILRRETVINLATGALLAGLRAAVISLAALQIAVTRCPLAVHGFALQFMTAFLLSDFARYWIHYMHHRFDVLWKFHRVHHSTRQLDASAGLRMHVVDFVQLSLIPVVLFGFLFDATSFDLRVWPLLAITTDFFDAFQHSDIAMTLESPLVRAWNRLFNNPVFHSWHHSTNPGEYNGNYGQALTIWDRIFNTHIPHRAPALDCGLPVDESLEASVLGLQLLRPDVRSL